MALGGVYFSCKITCMGKVEKTINFDHFEIINKVCNLFDVFKRYQTGYNYKIDLVAGYAGTETRLVSFKCNLTDKDAVIELVTALKNRLMAK